MKRVLTTALLLSICVGLLLSGGCTAKPEEAILGKWVGTNVDEVSLPYEEDGLPSIEFFKDGTGVNRSDSGEFDFAWKIDSLRDKPVLILTDKSDNVTFYFTIEDEVLITSEDEAMPTESRAEFARPDSTLAAAAEKKRATVVSAKKCPEVLKGYYGTTAYASWSTESDAERGGLPADPSSVSVDEWVKRKLKDIEMQIADGQGSESEKKVLLAKCPTGGTYAVTWEKTGETDSGVDVLSNTSDVQSMYELTGAECSVHGKLKLDF